MTLAWTTVLVIFLLLPGVAFLIGLSTPERHARDIVKASAIGDVAIALFVAILLHIAAYAAISVFGFNVRGLARALAISSDPVVTAWRLDIGFRWIVRLAVYVLAVTLTGFVLGFLSGRLILSGPLRSLATHRWVYDVLRYSADGKTLVTAYVLTTIVENERALMYKGLLDEFYLTPDGGLSYVVLRNGRRFFMRFDQERPVTDRPLSIFDGAVEENSDREWNYLMIPGSSIANVLFDRSPLLATTGAGERALNRALDAIRHD